MPVTGTTQTIKEEVITADGWEVIAIHIVKPIEPDESNPARLRVVWGCTLLGVDTGETVEVNLEGQAAIDFIVSDMVAYNTIKDMATTLGKAETILPLDAV